MQRALILLNSFGCEAGRYKLKNGLKTQKMHFLPVIELILDSLTAIKDEPHKCHSHFSILLIQGPIHKIFTKNIENWWLLKTSFFESAIFFFQKFLFASSTWKWVPNYVFMWMGLNFFYYDDLQPKMI